MSTVNPDDQPNPWIKWEIEVSADAYEMPENIKCAAFEDAVILDKLGQKVGIGMTIVELDASIAILDWIVRACIKIKEAEQSANELRDIRRSIEGR